jgi:hypothetical protein
LELRVEEAAPLQMPDRALDGGLGKSGPGRDALQAHGHGIPSSLPAVPQQKEIDQECCRPAVVPDEVGEQKIDDAGVEDETCHTDKDYSDSRQARPQRDCMMTRALRRPP